MPSNLEWALRYIERYHYSPVPLWTVDDCAGGECSQQGECPPDSHGKHPRVKWQEPYLPDPVTVDQARDWWGRWPHAGIALLTGRRSGIDVIDVDPKNGGSRETLAARWAGIPEELTVRTGSGGWHLYVAWPGVPTSNGVAKDLGLAGVDYRGDGGLVVAPPTVHHSGNVYALPASRPPEPLATPDWLVDIAKRRHDAQRQSDERAAELARRLAASPPPIPIDGATDTGRNMAAVAVRKIAESVASAGKPGGRHDTVRDQAYWLAGLVPSGHVTEDYVRRTVTDAAAVVVAGEGRDPEMATAIEWGIQQGQCKPWQPEERNVIAVAPTQVSAPRSVADQPNHDDELQPLRAVVDTARRYQHIPDPAHLIAALAAAATSGDDDEPVWLLLVAAPSSGKTETTKALEQLADARLDDITAAGLLSWKPGKNGKATGVLARIGAGRWLVTFGDLSSLLATSDRGGRDTVFSLLRSAYDGYVTRNLGSAPAPLEWHGRLTVVAAVTGVIDQYASHNDALGPRWLYVRVPEADTASRRKAARLSRRGGITQARDALKQATTTAVTLARSRLPDKLDETVEDAIEDAALVTCWGRAAVPRHGYGQREIDGAPTIEEPPRLIRQLRGLARGLAALGLDPEAVTTVTRRVALDSMPATRRSVLDVLADGEPLTTAALGRAARLHRHVARRQLEELEAIGVVTAHREGPEPLEGEQDRRIGMWRLEGEDGVLVARVLQAAQTAARRWHEMWVPPTPPPQIREEGMEGSHTSCHPPTEATA